MKVEFLEGSKRAKLLETVLTYGQIIERGFEFDGASYVNWFGLVAMALVGLHPFHPKIRRSALVHDALYTKGQKNLGDRVFKRIMKTDGANPIQVFACYWAVKIFGKAKKQGR